MKIPIKANSGRLASVLRAFSRRKGKGAGDVQVRAKRRHLRRWRRCAAYPGPFQSCTGLCVGSCICEYAASQRHPFLPPRVKKPRRSSADPHLVHTSYVPRERSGAEEGFLRLAETMKARPGPWIARDTSFARICGPGAW